MRLNDRGEGSIKTILILSLLAANLAVAFSHQGARAQGPGSARAFAENLPAPGAAFPEALGESSRAREARALPGTPPR